MKIRLFPSVCLGALLVSFIPSSEGQIRFPSGGSSRPINQRPVTPRPLTPTSATGISGCNCISKSQCPTGFGQLGTVCLTESGDTGVCCLQQEGVVLNRVGFAAVDTQPVNIAENVIDTGFEMGRDFFSDLMSEERRRLRAGEFLQRGDPARGHAFFFQRSASAKAINDLAYTIAQSSREISSLESLSAGQSFFELPNFKIGPQQMGFQCPLNEVPRCDPNAKYRTIDGSCNNLGKPLLGRSETGFSRLTDPLYNDGIMEPRLNGVDGKPLPLVREASNTVLLDLNSPDSRLTLSVMQWSQFLDHDFTLSPFDDMDGEAIQCCKNGQLVSPMPVPCFPVIVPPNDGFYAPRNQRCINFVRSMLALNDNCALGPVEQLDVLTHWIDGSMIYGSTEEERQRVVDDTTGFMRTSKYNLPPINRTIDCEARNPQFPCFAGGDTRITEQPALTVMHTVWIREHNRVAGILKQLNPHWNPRKLFEETRRIIIAQVQHITYNDWLLLIIGKSMVDRLGIAALESGFRRSYNPSIDPRIANEFATAAFRFGHSTVQGLFKLISVTGRQSSLLLRDTFNSPDVLQKNPQLVEGFVNSLSQQNMQSLDNLITQELSNHLFQTPSFSFGMDLMSLNLQRGREHAIGTYNTLRELVGVGKARTFLDLRSTTSQNLIKRIQSVYRSVDDIDLFIGGMTERPVRDAIIGPTFANIIGKQFQSLLNGDRFFYDMEGQAGSFTSEQLQEIRKSSLARIYCDNSDVTDMQPQVFLSVSRRNPRVPCNSNTIPSLNLQVFKEF